MNSYFLNPVFQRYIPKEDEEHREGTPMLGEEDEAMKQAIESLKGR